MANQLLRRAALVVPATFVRHEGLPNGDLSNLTLQRRQALLSLDRASVIPLVTEYWPEFGRQVVESAQRMLDKENAKERDEERYEIWMGRDGKAYPPAPVLLWGEEVFQNALGRVLLGVEEHLWRSGSWAPEYAEALIRRLVPDVRLHVGLTSSRTPRPNWPLPSAVGCGVSELPRVGADDPEFPEWVRFAIFERQYVRDADSHRERPSSVSSLFAGAVAASSPNSVPSNVFPFGVGGADDWWSPDGKLNNWKLGSLGDGPVVQLVKTNDWLGERFVPVFPKPLRTLLSLSPGQFGERISLKDAEGKQAVVLRIWNVVNPNALFVETAEVFGCDLIVRPDIFERLARLYGTKLFELSVSYPEAVE